MEPCAHADLILDTPLPKSRSQQFIRPSTPERAAACNGQKIERKTGKRVKKTHKAENSQKAITLPPSPSTYPGPLVLPGDDLFHDPEYPPQTMQEWIDEGDRNEVTQKRKTVYVVSPPSIPDRMGFIGEWADPSAGHEPRPSDRRGSQPRSEDVLEYLQAFYHPLPVKLLDMSQLQWVEWDAGGGRRRKPDDPQYIGLDIGGEAVRITARKSPDGLFVRQLNLNDLIDATITFLPKDAYSLLMLLEHDIYEDEDDDFCCGRAYGNSRVAVISMARYNPSLDVTQAVEREHAWPASHCRAYRDGLSSGSVGKKRAGRSRTPVVAAGMEDRGTAMQSAVSACHRVARQEPTSLWLGRVCKTASHEIGHCFALDHCVFYACVMQGTCGMSEDARQPPYLCPVDLAKLLAATGALEKERDEALLRFCQKHEERDGMFAGFAAWLRFRLQ